MTLLPAEVIRRKRDGAELSGEEIGFLVDGITHGGLSDAQVGALAMALFLRGMEAGERVALTEAMRDSGTVIPWDLDRPVLDKHSTGGVGDKVSLMLAPVPFVAPAILEAPVGARAAVGRDSAILLGLAALANPPPIVRAGQ